MQIEFKKTKVVKVDLEGGDSIRIKPEMDYESFVDFLSLYKDIEKGGGSDILLLKGAIPLLKNVIVDWSIKDKDGKKIEYAPEVIDKLSNANIIELMSAVKPVILDEGLPVKKNKGSSKRTLKKA